MSSSRSETLCPMSASLPWTSRASLVRGENAARMFRQCEGADCSKRRMAALQRCPRDPCDHRRYLWPIPALSRTFTLPLRYRLDPCTAGPSAESVFPLRSSLNHEESHVHDHYCK